MQVKYKTNNGIILFIKVSENEDNFDLKYNYLRLFDKYGISETIKLSSPYWSILGFSSKVTNTQAAFIMDKTYHNYQKLGEEFFLNALDSFKSLMKFLNIYEINPIEKPPKDITEDNLDWHIDYNEYSANVGKWIVLFHPN